MPKKSKKTKAVSPAKRKKHQQIAGLMAAHLKKKAAAEKAKAKQCFSFRLMKDLYSRHGIQKKPLGTEKIWDNNVVRPKIEKQIEKKIAKGTNLNLRTLKGYFKKLDQLSSLPEKERAKLKRDLKSVLGEADKLTGEIHLLGEAVNSGLLKGEDRIIALNAWDALRQILISWKPYAQLVLESLK